MWRMVGRLDELWEGELRPLSVGGQPVLLLKVEDAVHAYIDRCVHQRTPLSTGRLTGRILTCPTHQWQYDATTGAGINPGGVNLTRLPVEVRAGDIWIDVGR